MRTVYLWIKAVATKKGVRKVPISSTSLTGAVLGAEFESSLERDLIMLMAFHRYLDWFQPQPVQINYKGPNGSDLSYTPDLLVKFTDTSPEVRGHKPILCEVKYREDLKANWAEYRPKFRAAFKHAKAQGWRFKIFDEGRIRTQELLNIQFLWRYRWAPYDKNNADVLINALIVKRCAATMYDVVRENFSSDEERGVAIWTWWCLVAKRLILFDITQKIENHTTYWLPQWRYE